MDAIESFSQKSALSIETLTTLFEYFREKFNSNFQVGTLGTLENIAVIPKDHVDFLRSKDYQGNLLKKYVKVINNHLNHVAKKDKEVQRLFTRIRQKIVFTSLNDMGAYNYMLLFLGVYEDSKETVVIKTFLEIIDSGKHWILIA